MPSYLLETYLPRGSAADRRARERAIRLAADALARDGTTVCFGDPIYVPEDEICLLRVDAASIHDVERLVDRSGIRLLRVVKAIRSPRESRTTCADRPSPTP